MLGICNLGPYPGHITEYLDHIGGKFCPKCYVPNETEEDNIEKLILIGEVRLFMLQKCSDWINLGPDNHCSTSQFGVAWCKLFL